MVFSLLTLEVTSFSGAYVWRTSDSFITLWQYALTIAELRNPIAGDVHSPE